MMGSDLQSIKREDSSGFKLKSYNSLSIGVCYKLS